MNEQLEQQAEQAARLLLQRFKAAYPSRNDDATPVEIIAEWLELDMETFPPSYYPPGTYGFMDPDEEEHLIWLCSNLSETLRRFTLAHELGHALLHCRGNERIQQLQEELGVILPLRAGSHGRARDPMPSREDPCSMSDIQDGSMLYQEQEFIQESLGIGHAYDPRSQHEIAANAFAAELLMPLERVRFLYLSRRIAPSQLAEHFGVSQAAMLNRLAGLLKYSISVDEDAINRPLQRDEVEDVRDQSRRSGKGNDVGTDSSRPRPQRHYDEFQRAAIEAATPALITAGPGSGKTSTLIGRVEYLVHTLDVAPSHILALTFSRKAAREMEERLQQVLEGHPKISTFHAFCADLLREYGEFVGLRADFTLIDEAEGYFMLRQVSPEMRLHHYQNLHMPTLYFTDMLKAISRAKDELVSPAAYAQLAQQMVANAQNDEERVEGERALEVAHVYRLYEDALQRRGDTDFGGLLVLTIQLLREYPEVLAEIQQQYEHMLVDEFQDMNRASGVLLRELAGSACRVWVVGDPNQAIYGFRGASSANIGNFTIDFPGATVLPLSRNYRSRPDLVSLAESFRYQHLQADSQAVKNQPVRPTELDAYVTLATANNEASEIAGVIHDIRAKHAAGYAYKDMAILCRTRSTVQKFSRAFVQAGLPVVERSGMLEQEHIKNALAIVLLVIDKSGMGLVRVGRQTAYQISQADLESLLLAAHTRGVSPIDFIMYEPLPATISYQGRRTFARLAEILQLSAKPYIVDIWSLLADYLLLETTSLNDVLARKQDKESQKIIADYDALLQLARHYDQHYQARLAAQSPETQTGQQALTQRAKGFLEYLSLLVTLRQDGGERSQVNEQDEEEADVIRVMTVHASKGLEFPIVYLPGIAQRRFPSQIRANSVPPPKGMLPPESEGKQAHESGEAYLFYVGLTRARDHIIISRSERYGKSSYKPSNFLDGLLVGLVNERVSELRWELEAEELADEQLATTDAVFVERLGEAFIKAMKPPDFTASAIEAYVRCPRQYAYANIYRFESEEHTYRLFWQATQNTVEELQKHMQTSTTTNRTRGLTPEEASALYTQHWQALGGPDAPFAGMYERHGREVVESIRHELASKQEQDWHMRPGYTVSVAGKTVRVNVDRVESSMQAATPTPVRFVRTRFGKRKEKPSAEMRDMLYMLAYRQMHPGQKVELHSHNMSTGEIVPITITAKKEESLYKEAEQSVLGMERDEYPATPADATRCPNCPFFFICPA